MQTLPRYLLWGALGPTITALVVMLGLVWLLQSLKFLDFVINKGLGLGIFIELTGLLIPLLLTVILPLAVFAGVAFSFRRLGDESELTSLFAAGWSRLWVLAPSLLMALLAVALGYGLHLALLPASTAAFKDLQYQLRNEQADLLLEEGTFNQLGRDLMVYLKRRTTPTSLEMLLVHDTREPAHPVTWMAQSGNLTVGADGQPRLVLHNGIRQDVQPRKVEMLEFEEHALDLKSQLGPTTFGPRQREMEEYSLRDLWDGRGAATGKQRDEMRAEAHRRLLWPLAPLPLVLWAGACLLQVPGRRSSTLKHMAIASAGAIAFMALLMGAKGAAEGGNTVILYGQWLLPVGLAAYSLWKLRTASYG